MGLTRRKKKKTQEVSQTQAVPPPGNKVPKSFVLARGKLPALLRNLQHDLRKLMMPHTAMNLKETSRNKMKDFVHVAAPLGVTHFLVMSNTKTAPYLRIARSPHGPTLTFKVHAYSLAADIARAQAHPRAPPSIYKTSPLVVLNGFGTGEEHLKLITIMFQNMFPAINVNTVKLATCQRVLLLNYDKKTKCIDFRHYSISAQPTGVSRNIRKLVQRRKLPDLRNLNDVSEFVIKAGYGSESEAEDEGRVELADEYGKGNHASQQSSVKLHEVGPRMTLQLVKVEEGLCSGGIMFHEYVKKTSEEVAALREHMEKREALRKQRKGEQDANVKRKEQERNARKRRRPLEEKAEDDGEEDTDDEDNKNADEEPTSAGLVEEKEIDDAEWYRREVGEEPDEGFMTGSHQRPHGKFFKRFGKSHEADGKRHGEARERPKASASSRGKRGPSREDKGSQKRFKKTR